MLTTGLGNKYGHLRRWRVWSLGLVIVGGVFWSGAYWRAPHHVGPAARPAAAPARAVRWRFAFVGDTHADFALADRLFAAMAAEQPRFVIHLGDMVDNGSDPDQWRRLHELVARHRLRLLPVVGNHDVDRQLADQGASVLRKQFDRVGPAYYVDSSDDVDIVALNSEQSLVPGTAQANWLHEVLARTARVRVVCLHRPVVTCSRRDGPQVWWRRMCLHAPLRDHGVLLVLSGHNHSYERSCPLDGVTYIVSGGGAPNTYAAGKRRASTAQLAAGQQHYGVVEVTDHALVVRVRTLDGQLLDSFELPRLADTLPVVASEMPAGRVLNVGVMAPEVANRLCQTQQLAR